MQMPMPVTIPSQFPKTFPDQTISERIFIHNHKQLISGLSLLFFHASRYAPFWKVDLNEQDDKDQDDEKMSNNSYSRNDNNSSNSTSTSSGYNKAENNKQNKSNQNVNINGNQIANSNTNTSSEQWKDIDAIFLVENPQNVNLPQPHLKKKYSNLKVNMEGTRNFKHAKSKRKMKEKEKEKEQQQSNNQQDENVVELTVQQTSRATVVWEGYLLFCYIARLFRMHSNRADPQSPAQTIVFIIPADKSDKADKNDGISKTQKSQNSNNSSISLNSAAGGGQRNCRRMVMLRADEKLLRTCCRQAYKLYIAALQS
ncbi:MAG: hypothetical protein EZS28_016198 [Streblomastix strix]|uniref:Uncharacterized protein n=1 Tax=Streblomastix strix TaxID=222440 RepID=A0A5J4W1F6_9EUKA|nr:MAG: hypothetical protein EZS28_016198 [Streblomastix strix]